MVGVSGKSGRKPNTPAQIAAGFFRRVEKGAPDKCWHWTGDRTPGGYGTIRHVRCGRRRHIAAHRLAWELANQLSLTAADVVLHTCDTPSCCNPAHLRRGTQSDNMRDMACKKRHWAQAKTHCKNGHPFDAVNTRIGKKKDGRLVRLCRRCDAAKYARWLNKHRKPVTA